MSAGQDLTQAYEQWRSWSQAETAALTQADWPQVARCHAAKEALQPAILQLTEAARLEAERAGRDPAEAQRAIRELISELLSLETTNDQFLKSRHQAAEERKCGLDRASRKLSQMRRSYVPSILPSWQSYS